MISRRQFSVLVVVKQTQSASSNNTQCKIDVVSMEEPFSPCYASIILIDGHEGDGNLH